MFQPKSSRLSAFKVLYLLPILAVAVVAVAGEKPKENGYNLYVNTTTTKEQPLMVVDGKIVNFPAPKQQVTIQDYIESHIYQNQ